MAQAVSFEAPYRFKQSEVTVVLTHVLEKQLRHDPDDVTKVDANGGHGKKARWRVTVRTREGILEATFQNEDTGDYLRIKDDEVDVAGKGGKHCWFRVHKQNVGIVKLESCEHNEKYVAVNNEGVKVGKGGPWCRFLVLKEGVKPPFRTPYYFGRKRTVVVEHRDLQHIRVAGADSEELTSEGGVGQYAQFEAIPHDGGKKVQLKSLKTGKFLRIRKDDGVDCGGPGGHGPQTFFKVHAGDHPNQVRLESERHGGKYLMLAPAKKSFKVGDGKNKRCLFTFWREN